MSASRKQRPQMESDEMAETVYNLGGYLLLEVHNRITHDTIPHILRKYTAKSNKIQQKQDIIF